MLGRRAAKLRMTRSRGRSGTTWAHSAVSASKPSGDTAQSSPGSRSVGPAKIAPSTVGTKVRPLPASPSWKITWRSRSDRSWSSTK